MAHIQRASSLTTATFAVLVCLPAFFNADQNRKKQDKRLRWASTI
jgi:hypothetical protein